MMDDELFDLIDEETPNQENREMKELEKVEPTLVANMERIVELAKSSGLSAIFYEKTEENAQFVADKMKIAPSEAIVLSLFVELSNGGNTASMDRLSRYLRCSNLKMMKMKKDVDSLVDRGFLKHASNNSPFPDDSQGYAVPKALIDAIMENKPYKPEPITGLNMEQLFDKLAGVFDTNFDTVQVLKEVDLLLNKNPKLQFSRMVKKNIRKVLNQRDQFLFYFFCNQFVNEGDNDVSEREWRPFFNRRLDLMTIRREMATNENVLQKMGLVEANSESGMFGPSFRLSFNAKNDYLSDLQIVEAQAKQSKDLLSCDSFTEKHLFYNSEEAKAIGQITSLLHEDKFKAVQQRLEEMGMRKGFACLFYGAPGTGKTETVNQIARLTGRDVMVVDVSRIKDKFVGESEKNIKEAFDRYRAHVKRCDKAPILLFNEADAILGVRMEGAQHSVDKMNNSIQNIILQEMESLDGIMIATTNLTQNLDSAFERRFIYKVEFRKPSVEAKMSIWQSLVPTLTNEMALKLAEGFDFSGGQIENVARKRAVSYVLTGEEPTEEMYLEFCNEEMINNRRQRCKVGFC